MAENNRKLKINKFFKIGTIFSLQFIYVFHRWMYIAFLDIVSDQAQEIILGYKSIHQTSLNYIYSGALILMFIVLRVLYNRKKMKILNLIDGILSCLLTLACLLFIKNYPSTILSPEKNNLFILLDIIFGLQMGYGMSLFFISSENEPKFPVKKTKAINSLFIAIGLVSAFVVNVIDIKYYYLYIAIVLGFVNLLLKNYDEFTQKEGPQVSLVDSKPVKNVKLYRCPQFNYFYSIIFGLSIWYIAYIYLGAVFEKMEDYNNQEFTLTYMAWIGCIWIGSVIYLYSDNLRKRNRRFEAIIDLTLIFICLIISVVIWLPKITNKNYWIYYIASGLLMILAGYSLGKASDLLPFQRVWMIILTIALFLLVTFMAPESHFINFFYTPYNYVTLEEQIVGLLEGFLFIPFVLLLLWIIHQSMIFFKMRMNPAKSRRDK
ncbi:MAG: hypothetical protein ACTSRA_09045 [Promethearchaeota archaeon]